MEQGLSRSLLGDPERRNVTIMFCDVVGSTELAARLDPEALAEVLVGRLERWTAIIERQGGYVARYMGDGLLAYFGYPRSRSDDAQRAAAAALEVVAARGDVAVRVGVATGEVLVGRPLGRGAAREIPVFGLTPNLAARLQAAAAPNSTVISDETRRRIRGAFRYQALGALQLKGVSEPVAAWQLTG